MVHLEPNEYRAVADAVGDSELDRLTDCESTGVFWARLQEYLRPAKWAHVQQQIQQAIPESA